jgi:hypothetical protein
MKAKIKIKGEEEYIYLTPETAQERDHLIELWQKEPDVRFEKRGSLWGDLSLKEHRFVIAIIQKRR